MSPNEDCVVYFEQIQDVDSETPQPFTGDRVLNLLDNDGNVVLAMGTQIGYINLRPGTTNIDEIVIPWSVTSTLAPGEYHGAYAQVHSTTSREVLCDFVFQQVAP